MTLKTFKKSSVACLLSLTSDGLSDTKCTSFFEQQWHHIELTGSKQKKAEIFGLNSN